MSSIHILPPECLEHIIKFVKEDQNSNLYSCILVNRHWRDNSLPLLWSRPFDNILTPSPNGVKLMNTYISCLSMNQKQHLNNKGIILPQTSMPKINYPGYLRELKYEIFERYTRFWLLENNYSDRDSSVDFETILNSLEYSDMEYNNNQLKPLLLCLCSMFIEKSISLTYFSFYSCGELCLDLPEFPMWTSSASSTTNSSSAVSSHVSPPTRTSSNLLGNLTTFICGINDKDLSLPNLMKFMKILSRQCKKLKAIDFTWKNQYDRNICNYLVDIIKKQHQLKGIRLNVYDINIDRVIEVLVNTQRHSLTSIHFENVNFSNTSCVRLFNSLNEFYKLEMLALIDCRGLNSCTTITNPGRSASNLKSLHLYSDIIDDMQLHLLRNSGNGLEKISLKKLNNEIIDTLVYYCPNINTLKLMKNDLLNHSLSQNSLERLFNSLRENLKLLIIDSLYDGFFDEELTSSIARLLPKSLSKLVLNCILTEQELEGFLSALEYNLECIVLSGGGYYINLGHLHVLNRVLRQKSDKFKCIIIENVGQEHWNFSEWNELDQLKKLTKVIIREGDMPLEEFI